MEEWRGCITHPHLEVSSRGNVRYTDTKEPFSPREWGGYRYLDGVSWHGMKVSVAILLAFVGPRLRGMKCCHKDDNRSNDSLGNLYWGSTSDNLKDAVRNGKLKMTEERKRKIGISNQKYRPSKEHQQRMTEAARIKNTGRKLSQETKSRIGTSNRGKVRSEAVRESLRRAWVVRKEKMEIHERSDDQR